MLSNHILVDTAVEPEKRKSTWIDLNRHAEIIDTLINPDRYVLSKYQWPIEFEWESNHIATI